ncbi:MAG: DUF4251 domain-containing protein [Paludibacter sp.]|nr:DUF4251 domain-containing protein [Paludibacter sp.]
MKTQISSIVALLLFFMSSCSTVKTAPETIEEITGKVESKDFTVVMNYANPMRMKPVFLTSEYDLRIKNDSAFAYLPYYGVAHVAPFDTSDGGIKFAAPMMDYKITPNKRSTGWEITFRVKSNLSLYDIHMNIFNNGSTSVSINSYERDMISFEGEIKRDLMK